MSATGGSPIGLLCALVLLGALAGPAAALEDGAGSGSVPGAEAAASRTYARFAFKRQYRPSTIYFGAHSYMTDISWSKWRKKAARGSGMDQVNDCTPSCADGTITGVAANVFLTGRLRCGKFFVFGRMKIVHQVAGVPDTRLRGFCPKPKS